MTHVLKVPLDSIHLCANAASEGNLKLLQKLRQDGHPWDDSTCVEAALNGHYDLLTWAVSNGCCLSATVFVSVVYSLKTTNLHILDWLKKVGCIWDIRALQMARERDRDDIINWLILNNSPAEWFKEEKE